MSQENRAMPTARKLTSKSAIVSDKVKDYGNDPFVVKKNRQAKALLEKYGFPKELSSGASQRNNL
jgi:hypothetical protein